MILKNVLPKWENKQMKYLTGYKYYSAILVNPFTSQTKLEVCLLRTYLIFISMTNFTELCNAYYIKK